MKVYILRRILLMIPTLLGITLVTFFIVNSLPGGPVEQKIMELKYGGSAGGAMGGGQESGGGGSAASIDEEYIQALKEYYGFDKPIHERYFHWLGKIVQLDLGESYYYEEPVLDVIKTRLPVSITFGLTALLITYLICIPLGIIKAIFHRSNFDNITSGIIFMGYSVPGFAFLILLIVLFGGGTLWDVFPIQGFTSENFSELSFFGQVKDLALHMAMPLAAYSITLFAFNTMLMKNSLIEQLTADYVRTAYAKGLSGKMIIIKHALRNALIPIATGVADFLVYFLAGSVLIETISGLDGMGRLGYESLLNRDYPVALGIILISSLAVMIGNLLADITYTIIDPRIDFK